MVRKIVSGGQTGADRAALDFAIARGIPHGGWCPKGRLAEDGAIDPRYQLVETPSANYEERTGWNVRDSDGTVIFTISPRLSGGSKFTAECAARLGKPCIHLFAESNDRAGCLAEFVKRHNIAILNVAGSRASGEPGIYEFVASVLAAGNVGRE
jgi:hypothetical protein